jgi:hypothetical protein
MRHEAEGRRLKAEGKIDASKANTKNRLKRTIKNTSAFCLSDSRQLAQNTKQKKEI